MNSEYNDIIDIAIYVGKIQLIIIMKSVPYIFFAGRQIYLPVFNFFDLLFFIFHNTITGGCYD